jgi:hypothetical protein
MLLLSMFFEVSIPKEGGLYYMGGAFILDFIRNGANLAHLFRKMSKRQK